MAQFQERSPEAPPRQPVRAVRRRERLQGLGRPARGPDRPGLLRLQGEGGAGAPGAGGEEPRAPEGGTAGRGTRSPGRRGPRRSWSGRRPGSARRTRCYSRAVRHRAEPGLRARRSGRSRTRSGCREFTDARLPGDAAAHVQQGADLPRAGDGAAHARPHQDARGARRGPPLREEDARQGLAPPSSRRGLVQGTQARTTSPSGRALWSGGSGGHRRLEGPDDRAGAPAGRRTCARPGSSYEDEVESVVKKNSELIAKARFELDGTSTYPDATFTAAAVVRLGAGWTREDGVPGEARSPSSAAPSPAPPGEPPFDLPPSWLKAKDRLDADHAVRLRDHQRHHRRQLGVAGHQPGRGDRRPGVRREPAVAGRRLRVRPPEQPHGVGGQPRADRGAGGGVRRGPAGAGAAAAGAADQRAP